MHIHTCADPPTFRPLRSLRALSVYISHMLGFGFFVCARICIYDVYAIVCVFSVDIHRMQMMKISMESICVNVDNLRFCRAGN